MSTIDTRSRIIDVARRIFAERGIENTTMNDIAEAANRSRRTVYTYFQSKEELLTASIEKEMEKISIAITKIASSELPPDKKLIELIFARLRTTRNVVRRNGTLKNEYFNNMWIVEQIRKNFDAREIALFRSVISEGEKMGLFHTESPDMAARFLHFCLKGIEMPFIQGIVNKHKDEKFARYFTEKIIISALGGKMRVGNDKAIL